MENKIDVNKEYVKEAKEFLVISNNYHVSETELSGTVGGRTAAYCDSLSKKLSINNKNSIPNKQKLLIENTRKMFTKIGVTFDSMDKELAEKG